ncbi:MAG TPA: rhodanese-like domain-containing protein [Solirubrobacterales bacterium]
MTDQAEAVLSLEPARINALLQSGEAVVIDIRRDYEYEAGHVPGSRHIEINDVSANADSIPRDRTIVFYCRSGNRSGMPAEAFRQAGYEAYNMEGGLTAWVEAGLPLEPEGGEIAQPLPV